MSPEEIERTFSRMEYVGDDRRAPDERRRARFLNGWKDATERRAAYAAATLRRLTWNNLGFRFGREWGVKSADTINAFYDHLAVLWHRTYGSDSGGTDSAAPSPSQYIAAFQQAGVSDAQRQLLRLHYNAPERTITARQLASASGSGHYSVANSQYGRLGRTIGGCLEYNPTKERLGTLVTFDKRNGEWHWIMRPQVAQAIEQLGWGQPSDAHTATVPAAAYGVGEVSAAEGRVLLRLHRVRERDAGLVALKKQSVLSVCGRLACEACGFDFAAVYGSRGEGYAECHHTQPISQSAPGRLTVASDLEVVCANCHRMLHRQPWVSVRELRELLSSRRGGSQTAAAPAASDDVTD